MTTLMITLEDESAKVLAEEAVRAGLSVEEFLRRKLDVKHATLSLGGQSPAKKDTLSRAKGLGESKKSAPTDTDVKQIIEEERLKKYGGSK